MAEQGLRARAETRSLLTVRTSSRLIPIILLLVVIAFLVAGNTGETLRQLAITTGFVTEDSVDTVTLQTFVDVLNSNDEATTERIAEKIKGLTAAQFFTDIVLPAFSVFFSQMLDDFKKIALNIFQTFWQIGLYALVPGIAGLVYRRSFWTWFSGSFVLLFVLNATGLFGGLTTADTMPISGQIFFFIVAQIAFLLAVKRLHRHTNWMPSILPPLAFNALLLVLMLFVGFVLLTDWLPGFPDGTVSGAWNAVFGAGVLSWILKMEFVFIALPTLYFLLRASPAWLGRAPKNIVVCFDGTSNTPEQYELGLLAQTNVFKLFKMLKSDKGKTSGATGLFDASLFKKYENKQIAFYYTGVGNRFDNDPISQTLGLAVGFGASAVIDRAYLDIMRVYRPEDRVYIFGFSRGAAMARLLARAIDERGAPKTVWSMQLFGRHWTIWQSGQRREVPISVLGCWDTVGSFGIAKTIAGINFQQMNMFKDLTVPETVERAYHLVALDEQRDSFEPTLMDPDPITPERITEIWYSGDHANVGGGWATDRLSDLTLDFMLQNVSSGYAKAVGDDPGDEAWGLFLTAVNRQTVPAAEQAAEGAAEIHPDPLGQLRSWSSMLYTYRPRKLPSHAVISETVFERMTNAIPVYAPESLFNHNEELDKKRDAIAKEVARLGETNSLTPDERERVLAFKDTLRLKRWPDYRDALEKERAPKKPAELLSNAERGVVRHG